MPSCLYSITVPQQVVRHRSFGRPVIDNAERDGMAGVRRWRVKYPVSRFCGAPLER